MFSLLFAAAAKTDRSSFACIFKWSENKADPDAAILLEV